MGEGKEGEKEKRGKERIGRRKNSRSHVAHDGIISEKRKMQKKRKRN